MSKERFHQLFLKLLYHHFFFTFQPFSARHFLFMHLLFTIQFKHSPVRFPIDQSARNILLLTPNNQPLTVQFQINILDKLRDVIQRAKVEIVMALGQNNNQCAYIDIFDNLLTGFDVDFYQHFENKPGLTIDSTNDISIYQYYRQLGGDSSLTDIGFYFRYMTSYQQMARINYISDHYFHQQVHNNNNNIVNDDDHGPAFDAAGPAFDAAAERSTLLCVICMEQNREIVTMPCRHLSMCSCCAGTVSDMGNSSCPICRCAIVDTVTVYI